MISGIFRWGSTNIERLKQRIRKLMPKTEAVRVRAIAISEALLYHGQLVRELEPSDFERWLAAPFAIIDLAVAAERAINESGRGALKAEVVKEAARVVLANADSAFDLAWDSHLKPALERFIEKANETKVPWAE